MRASAHHAGRRKIQDSAREETPAAPHILIVDDDQGVRETLRMALEDEGFAVYEAADGDEALRLLRMSRQPLVVVLDLRMPRMSGDALLRRVSRRERLPAQHAFLLVTASYDRLSPGNQRLLQRMKTPVIAKPFDLDELLSLISHTAATLASAAG